MHSDRFLILIDSTPIRKKAIRELNSTLKKLEKSRLDINAYLQESKPAFLSWYEKTLGELIQRVQKLEESYRKKEWEVREVFAYAEFYRISPALAYFRILERKLTPEAEREYDPFYEMEEERGYWEEEAQGSEQEESRSYNSKEDFRHASGRENFQEDKEFPNENSLSRKEELTALFRKIARFLHPDRNSNLTLQEKEIWHEALNHYQSRNVSGLKEIFTWLQIKQNGSSAEITISEIQSLNQRLKKDLKAVQKTLRLYKKQPDWNFTKKSKKEMKILQKEIEADLQSECISIHLEMEKLDRILYSWKQFARSCGLSS